MSYAVVDWLKTEFRAAHDVRSAAAQLDTAVIYPDHTADLVVQTWMGSRLYVYLLNQAPKARDIRSLLRENTRAGVGTLFIVRHSLLPADGTCQELNDWQHVLSILSDGWICAYRAAQASPALMQVHLTPTRTADEYQAWHVPDFSIESVHVRRRSLQGSMRGEWFVGDIASVNFRRRVNTERINQRFHYSTRSAPGGSARKSTTTPDRLHLYYELLQVPPGASHQEVKTAYRRMAMQYHPDVSALPRPEAERRFKEVSSAYEAIKNHHNWK